MKDTIFNGKKNNTYYQTILNKNRFNIKFRLSSSLQSRQLYIKDSLIFPYRLGLNQNQRKYYHISNIRAVNRIGPHNEDVLSVIIGSLLGEAYANKRSGEGVRICYRQSIRHKEYLFWLYTFFYNRGYTSNLQPRQYTRTIQSKEGKVYYGYEFNTFTFRSFSWIHGMFYNKGRKVIPKNIYEYLTPLALAVWIMDDGGWTNYGIRIATNSFKLKEVELLQDVIKSKYNLETTIQKIYIKDQYSIYIKKQSVNNLRNIVGPFIHFSMLHKLG
jgi:ubiquinol-cytochrome c reductase cytochrome b subunit